MLTEQEFSNYCKRLQLSDGATQWIKLMREGSPARRVQGRRQNVDSLYPSRKMKCTIQSESRTNELANIILWENDPCILEFWDQPGKEKFICLHDGKTKPYWRTPDFFVLESNACGWVECKKVEELEQLAKESPGFYERRPDGTWRCPPGEDLAASFGFFFKVANTPNPYVVTNLSFLGPYYIKGEFPVVERVRDAVLKLVKNNTGILLSELRAKCPDASADDLNALIACNAIYVDLSVAPLTAPERLRVFPNSALAASIRFLDTPKASGEEGPYICPLYEGLNLQWGERKWTVVTFTEQRVLLHGEEKDAEVNADTLRQLISKGEVKPLDGSQASLARRKKVEEEVVSKCTQEALEAGMQRYAIYLNPAQFKELPERTRERLRAKVRMAGATYGEEYGWVGLIPQRFRSGRRPIILPPDILEVFELAFKEYEKPAAIDFPAFRRLVIGIAATKQIGLNRLCCDKTMKRWLRKRSDANTLLQREGAKVATAQAPPMPVAEGWEPGGRWPWDKALIDHTKADVQLKINGLNVTKRVWLSIMLEGFSRKVLAFIIDFNGPSKRTLMHLMRECVRRHRRLPTTIVLDNAKEFKSVYFQKLLAQYFVTPDYRPPCHPRFGSQIERWFETANKRVFHQMLGNTKAMLKVRTLTKAIDPSRLAGWTLELLHEGFSEFCYEIYNECKHSSLGCSPDDKFNMGSSAFGTKHGAAVDDYQRFIMASMLTNSKGKATITRSGVSLFRFYFWHRDMAAHVGDPVPIRYDPCNIARVYVYIDKRWVCAKCGINAVIEGMSEKQRELAGKRLIEEQRIKGERDDWSERKFGEFMMTMKGKEAIFEQKRFDEAIKPVLAGHELEIASIEPVIAIENSTPLVPAPKKFLKPPQILKTYQS